MPAFESTQFTAWLLQALCSAFLAILFLQSGLDKVIDWKGNLGWLTGHFAKSPLRGVVPLMLGVITLMELAAGALSAAGLVALIATGSATLAFWGALVSAVSLVGLFFGQRMAKDYAGAGGLVPYFLLSLAAIYFTRLG
ncbi:MULTISPECIES: DoxX family protein [unclassified Myxococcus]|uniref:DoxX family protein n=1 Tax=unclassified Myxococcus TaxID=2648731 RepID=UPI00157BA5B3|nr:MULTISPECIES: DoxX family protein [unclassified Myxococcus]NTX36100.1 DoxX family protein [Myxococcus sp. CA033]NTX53921.1 DoxX family protein [Myxococcus sp. CA039A]